jgi:biopolymer transport protein ExbD
MLNLSDEQARHSAAAGPSIMPLLDVMLLLLIFFLLASVYVQPTLEVELPEADHSESAVEQNNILTISVSPDGDFFVNQTLVPLPDLQRRIEAALAQDADLPVLVRADKQSAFEYFVKVMDAVKGAGAKQLIIETQPVPREKEP